MLLGNRRFALLTIGAGLLLSAPGLAAEPSNWRGVKVLPKQGCVIKVGNEVFDDARFSMPYVVQKVNGEWLWIGGSKKGWVQKSQVVTLDEASAYYTQIINRNDEWLVWAYFLRALARSEKGEWDQAIADYEEAMQRAPDFSVYDGRGAVWLAKQDYDKAIADFSESVRLNPSSSNGLKNRGIAYRKKGEFEKAIADFEAVLRLDPHQISAVNNLAWLFATCPDERYRDGKRSVQLAKQVCGASGWTVSNDLDTLAAAYAEAGDFENAVKYENKAIELAPQDAKFVTGAKARLQLYSDHKPYRE